MKKVIALTTLLALCACSEAPADDAVTTDGMEEIAAVDAEQAGFEAVAPGTYRVAHEDGAMDELIIHPGMTWSMVYANGDAAGGTIFAQDGQNCFVTEGVEGHQCFAGSVPAGDGSIQVTSEAGETMTVTPWEEAM